MRVSIPGAAHNNTKTTTTTTNNNNNLPKPLNTNSPTSTTTTTTTTPHTTTTLCYEPTSVLDLQRSPSPAAAAPTVPDALSATAINNPNVDLDNLEGWDSILSELGLNDDSTPNNKYVSQFNDPPNLPDDFPHSQPFDHAPHPHLTADFSDPFPYAHPNFPPQDPSLDDVKGGNSNYGYGYGLDFIDDLIRAAQSFESNDSHHAQLILARLNNRLRSPAGKPLNRAAFYFKEALNQLLTGSGSGNSPNRPVRLSSYEIVQTIRAYKTFSGASPIPLFSTFTANQAILEAIDGSNFVHIIDFDIGFGGHWASLMREIVDKAPVGSGSGANPAKSMVLRITAIVPEEFGVESKLVRENLAQFARELNITFHLEFVLVQSFEILSFKAVKFIQGEKIAVHLSPATLFQRLGSRSSVSRFLGDLRGVAAHVVALVDREVGMDTGIASFSLNFVAGLEFYTAMLESLDAAMAGGGGGGGTGEWGRRIETYLIRPRIMEAVEVSAGRRGAVAPSWREVFAAAGIKAVGFSQFADFQAECLLRRAQVAGFHVAKRQGEMLLCWHDRPLVATSAWRC